MSDPETIYLQPWCAQCESRCDDDGGRSWCPDDPWGQCPDCGAMPVKYIKAPDQPQPEAEGEEE